MNKPPPRITKISRLLGEPPLRRAAASALVYVTVCTIYIVVSSRLAAALAQTTQQLQAIAAFKGIAFVVVTGVLFRMYYDEHTPPHIHLDHQGNKALLDFHGHILKGDLKSRTAIRLVREWIDLQIPTDNPGGQEMNQSFAMAEQGPENFLFLHMAFILVYWAARSKCRPGPN